MHTRAAIVLALSLPLAPAAAQVDPIALQSRPLTIDSGFLAHGGKARGVIFRRDVVIPGAAWLRLFFDRSHLPAGSELRLTAARDGAVQRHDARSLAEYGMSSACFNGERVTVELIAAAGTRTHRLRVARAEFVMPQARGESICGNTDDRRLSKDPRIGRAVSGAGACSWWLIDEFTILTAGHCVASAGSTVIVGFNIPLSTSNGTYVQPPPDDQYALDMTTMRSSNGFGKDWAVVAARRNSNHGMYPGQRQGSWFKLGPVPGSPSGVYIRITGNGRVSAPVSPTWNAVQKTHVGPCVRTASHLQYRTDTTGGNSGSPIIHEQTGAAIGIHTHGGCNTSGGQNSGTRIDLRALQAAIQLVRGSRVAGSLRVFGQACGSSNPGLELSGVPDLGGTVELRLVRLPAQQVGALLIGISDQTYQGVVLPLDLGKLGFGGCTLYTSIEQSLAQGSGSGSVLRRFSIPQTGALIGRSLFMQYAVEDGGVKLSNAGQVLFGG